jgi:hypothetical protein
MNVVGKQGVTGSFVLKYLFSVKCIVKYKWCYFFSLGQILKSVLFSSNIIPDIKISSFVYSGIASVTHVCLCSVVLATFAGICFVFLLPKTGQYWKMPLFVQCSMLAVFECSK